MGLFLRLDVYFVMTATALDRYMWRCTTELPSLAPMGGAAHNRF